MTVFCGVLTVGSSFEDWYCWGPAVSKPTDVHKIALISLLHAVRSHTATQPLTHTVLTSSCLLPPTPQALPLTQMAG